MKTLLLPAAFMAALLCSVSSLSISGPKPYQAFCKSIWLFKMPCAVISTKLVQQIEAFSPDFGCEECNYEMVSVRPMFISANHTSSDGLTAENLNFVFATTDQTEECKVTAMSKSIDISTKLLDNGINYCNLYNLLSASGLAALPDFVELINEWACLSYEQATCKQ